MIFIWGRKTIRKPDGIAADFCSICRQVSPVSVIQLRSQSHIYYVGIGSGELVGAICQCITCGTEWIMQAGTIQKTVPTQSQLSVATLIEETFPRLSIVYGERLAQEEAIRRNPFSLDANTRLSFIAEPFHLTNSLLLNYTQTSNSWEKIVSALIGVSCVFLGLITLASFIDANNMVIAWFLLSLTAATLWGTFALNRRGEQRFIRKKIYPILATCLSPLKPTHDELNTVLAHNNSKMAKQVVVSELMEMLGDGKTEPHFAEDLKVYR